MATLTFNADSAGVTATGMTKAGSTFTLDAVPTNAYLCQEASGSVLNDLAGNDGTIGAGITYQNTGPFVDTYALSGTVASFVTLPQTSLATDSTVEFWYKPSSADKSAGYAAVFGCWSPRSIMGYMHAGIFSILLSANSSSSRTTLNYSGLVAGTWHHIRVINSASASTLSVDGIQRHTTAGGGIYSPFVFKIGDHDGSGGAGMTGDFADMSIWDTALPSTYTVPTSLTATAGTPAGIVTIPADFGAGKAADFSTSAESLTGATATYQSTDDAGATNYVPTTPENLAALQARANTDLQLTNFRVYVSGSAADAWNSYSVDDQTPDVTPPGVPTISNLESVGSDPNLGFFSDWTEPVDVDFNHVKGQLNIDAAGWQDIDDTASLGGATPMKFNESLAGTQQQAAGWLYQNHYARNGYSEGTTAQTRFRSVDDSGNESAYSTSSIVTLESTADAPPTPSITGIDSGDGSLTITVAAGDETLKVFALYKQTNKSAAWSAESATFSRTGSGEIEITGLSNGTAYDVITYHKDSGLTCIGQPSNIYSGYPDSAPNGQYRHDRKIYQRDTGALALLQAAKEQGELMTFRNEGTGTTGVTVYGTVASEYSRNVGIRTGAVDLQEIIVSVPRQTNFPPDNFDLNGTIEVDGEEFQIQDYSTNPNVKTYAWEFLLNCSSVRGQEGY